jgi:membrane protein implicated in regulation of membrane protease activity
MPEWIELTLGLLLILAVVLTPVIFLVWQMWKKEGTRED